MTADGSSSPADLMLVPIVFTVVFLLVAAVSALLRRWGPGGRAQAGRGEPALAVSIAVRRLRAAGLDTDALLGPWLAEARQGRDQRDSARN